MAPFIEHFASLPDPRVVGRSDHKLLDIIAIAILGTICGAEGWTTSPSSVNASTAG
ncbi:transposase family protein [Sorangium sp. So ce590]